MLEARRDHEQALVDGTGAAVAIGARLGITSAHPDRGASWLAAAVTTGAPGVALGSAWDTGMRPGRWA